MKRLIALLLVLVLCAGMTSASAEGAELSYDRVVQMAQHIRSMASGDYLTIRGAPEDLQKKAREWTAGIDDTPELIVRMDIDDAAYVLEYRATFKAEHPMVAYEAESNAMVDIMTYSMLYAVYESVVTEAALEDCWEINSLLNASMLYAGEGEPGSALYIVLYEDAQPIFILATAENGAVSLQGMLVPGRNLAKCTSYAQVAFWFMRYGFPMTGEEVLPE